MHQTHDEMITTAEAAVLAGVNERTVRNWINSGKMAAKTDKSGRRVRHGDVVALLEEKGFASPALDKLKGLNGHTSESAETESAENVETAYSEPGRNSRQRPAESAETAESAEAAHTDSAESSRQSETESPEKLRTIPTESAERGRASRTEMAETLAILLQPIQVQLQTERERTDRFYLENQQLAGQVGFLQSKIRTTEARLEEAQQKLLEATAISTTAETAERTESPQRRPAESAERSESAESSGRRRKGERRAPWYKRIFGVQ